MILNRALTLPKLCVMVLDHMIQDHNIGANKSTVLQPHAGSQSLARIYAREYLVLCLERLAETTILHSLCTGANESLRSLCFFLLSTQLNTIVSVAVTQVSATVSMVWPPKLKSGGGSQFSGPKL